MENSISDIDFLKQVYNTARNKYKPSHIRVLPIAEAPPCALERFFYFEDVKKQDSLFLEIMGILYPREKDNYLKSGRDSLARTAANMALPKAAILQRPFLKLWLI
jgi:hypothetical protein